MKVLSVNYPKGSEDEEKIAQLNNHYIETLKDKVELESKEVVLPAPDLAVTAKDMVSGREQFKLLMWRNKLGTQRDPMHGRIRIFQTIFLGILCLILFHDQGTYS